MARVLISDELAEPGAELLRRHGIEIDNRQGLRASALREALRENDAVFVRSGTHITSEVLREPGRLRLIVRGGVGIDTIDVEAAAREGISVMTTPNSSAISVAEHTLGMIFAVARHIVAADDSVRSGKWERKRWTGIQLAGKTLGILGLGRIGSEVARRAVAFDMKVAAFDPFVSPTTNNGIEMVPDLDSLLLRCDVLTIHTPLTVDTTNLIGTRELGLLKKGARVVNCARGGIINEDALVEALRSGHLSGAALDVFAQEPPSESHRLFQMPNVVLTPHIGASTNEAQISIALEAAQLLIEFLL